MSKANRTDDIEVLKKFLSLPLDSTDEVFEMFKGHGGKMYGGEQAGRAKYQRFLWIPGTRSEQEGRITFMAHADTVFDEKYFKPVHDKGKIRWTGKNSKKFLDLARNPNMVQEPKISVDEEGKEFFKGTNPDVGLGADNRAGCAILHQLLGSGHNILITDGEEQSNDTGAYYLLQNHPDIMEQINKSRFCISFDSGNDFGYMTSVAASENFIGYIAGKMGELEHDNIIGGADIGQLCEGVSGAHCNAGTYNFHRAEEKVDIDEWLQSLDMARGLGFEKLPHFEVDPERTAERKEILGQTFKNIKGQVSEIEWLMAQQKAKTQILAKKTQKTPHETLDTL
jgi:hypothetical protein